MGGLPVVDCVVACIYGCLDNATWLLSVLFACGLVILTSPPPYCFFFGWFCSMGFCWVC